MPPFELMNVTTSAASITPSYSPLLVSVLALCVTVAIFGTLFVAVTNFRRFMYGAGTLLGATLVGYGTYRLYLYSRHVVVESVTGNPTALYWVGGVVVFVIVSVVLGTWIDKRVVGDDLGVKSGKG